MSGLSREAFLSLSSRFNGCLLNIALEGFVLTQAWHVRFQLLPVNMRELIGSQQYYYHFHRQCDPQYLESC